MTLFLFSSSSIAAKLLACPSEELTLNALKLIGKVLHHSNERYAVDMAHSLSFTFSFYIPSHSVVIATSYHSSFFSNK